MTHEANELFPTVPNLYEFPSVHADMLLDSVRMQAYNRAIERVVKPGHVVVDIGAGTGVLSVMCARVGASRVYAIERSSMAEVAREIVAANGCEKQVVVCNWNSSEFGLDEHEKADVLVSELIGHVAFEEGMVGLIEAARRNTLKSAGVSIPIGVDLMAAPISMPCLHKETMSGWRDMQQRIGIDCSAMIGRVLNSACLMKVSPNQLLSDSVRIARWRFGQEEIHVSDHGHVVHVDYTGAIHGLVFWWNALLADGITLSTNPWALATHWEQCVAMLREPQTIGKNRAIKIKIRSLIANPFRLEFTVEGSSWTQCGMIGNWK